MAREKIQLEIERLSAVLPGLDDAIAVLKSSGQGNAMIVPSAEAQSPASNEVEKINMPAEAEPLTSAAWPKTLYDVPEQHLRDLHAQGLSDNKITQELQRQGYSCNQGNTSRKLRAMGLRANGRRVPPGRDRVASVESMPSGEAPGIEGAPPEAETPQDDDWDQGPLYRKPEEPPAEAASAVPPKKRRGRPRKNSTPTEEDEYPIIGHAPSGAPQFGSMRMKVVEEKVVDGHKVKVLPPGYAQGAYPAKNVSVRS